MPALLFLPLVLSPPINHDVAAVLQFSQRWLAGEHLYTDLIDVNPPLIFVLNLVPALIDDWTPLNAVESLQLCMVALGLFAWLLAFRVRDRAAEGPIQRAFLDVLPALFLLAAGYDFAQREHIMAVGTLPYVLLAARRANGDAGTMPRSRRLAVGVLAGVAIALKPHFLAVPALIELAVIAGRAAPLGWRRGLPAAIAAELRDPVPLAMVAIWTLYLASLPILFADYLQTVVPLVWDLYLNLGEFTITEVLLVPRLATALCLLVPLLWITLRRPGSTALAVPRMLALAATGALIAAVAQHKGWSYHILPIELYALGLGALLAARWLDRARLAPNSGPHAIAAALAGLFSLYIISNGEAPWKQFEFARSPLAGLVALLKQEAAGERVLVFSPGIYPIFPALNYANTRLTLRTMNMWLLEGSYEQCLPDGRRYRDVWEMGRAEFFVFRTVAEDFARAPPAAVVVDRQPGIPWCGEEFNFIDYFKRHPLFAEVWSHYQLSAQWDRYLVYTRKD